jgi:aryl-alcohol dehydrogenase-like predicted oxidoreductase
MAKHFGMTVTPWAPLAGGALTGKYLRGDKGRLPDNSKRLNERAVSITQTVIDIANQLGVAAAHVALKWTMMQEFASIPIVGATKVTQMEENMKCLDVNLTKEHIEKLNDVSKIELGFPGDFLNEEGVKMVTFGGFYDKIEKRK